MASPSSPEQSSTGAPNAPAQPGSRPGSGHAPPSSSPVEMKTLHTAAEQTQPEVAPTSDAPSQSTPESPEPPASPKHTAPTNLSRTETEAIGPSTDTPASKPDHANGPVVIITLLLTTGARHPYKIDEKYLKKRNVNVDAMDPYNISVYTLKELIWRDWRDEWEPRPTSPSSIRLIHFGRMLDDKSPLKDCRFQTEAPNVVHMTVKPQEVVDDEDAKTGKGGGRRDDGEETHAGCRCVIL
ncbi:ubiquitin-like protein [Polyplosphaeria fusca]|uniref:Ubiquitin-like protein n=1 Tax=Polyplosphaeria fusca TaxID=682080 RepID=A0A9P4QY71_9PLEO|nr:ubiquitin-like protein [Polyplosphaeria fusca]